MPEFNYTDAELKAMKNQYAKEASPEQFELWIAECRNRGLVPVKDVVLQIRATKEWNPDTRQKEFTKKAVHITTIQALRKLAERTGKYAGQLPSIWIYLDGSGNRVESDIPLPESNGSVKPRVPWAAKASVVRKGFDQPVVVPARFEAYAQYFSADNTKQLNSTWANRGPEQLEKCAEALALRKAFPEELGGLYLQEEFTDEETVAATAQPSTENVPTQVVAAVPAQVKAAEPPKPVARKKKESVPDAGKPWGGLAGQRPAETAGQLIAAEEEATKPVTTGNIHGVDIKDDEIPFPGDPEPPKPEENRLPTDEEAKDIRARLIAVKEKGYSGLGQWILKVSGKPRTNDIPYSEAIKLVEQVEAAEKAGTLANLLK